MLQPLTINTKRSILNVAAALDPPLVLLEFGRWYYVQSIYAKTGFIFYQDMIPITRFFYKQRFFSRQPAVLL